MLQAHLLDERPDDVPDLHRRASVVRAERRAVRGDPTCAGCRGFRAAADLVELAAPRQRQYRQEVTLRRWLEALPEELLQVRPVLSNAYARSLLVRGEVEGVESPASRRAVAGPDNRWPSWIPCPIPGDGGRGRGGFRALPASIAVHRAGQARILGDTAGTMAYAQRALDLVDEDDHLGRGAAAALLGLAYWTNGISMPPTVGIPTAWPVWRRPGTSDLVGGAITQADIRIAQGRLREAMSRYERGLQIATQQAGTVLRGAADMHEAGMVLRERNDLAAAVQHLRTSKELGEPTGLPQNRYRWRVAMAGVGGGRRPGRRVDLLNEAQRVYLSDFSPECGRSRLADTGVDSAGPGSVTLSAGCVSGICPLTRTSPTCAVRASPSPECSWPGTRRSVQRVFFKTQRDSWSACCDGGRREAERERSGDRGAAALVHQARGDMRAALASLQRALTLAEPEGYVRLFVDEGQLARC